jgi:hypothetical protein
MQPLLIIKKLSTMKKLVLVLFCCIFGIGAALANEPDYVISNEKVYLVESLRISPWMRFSGKSEGERLRFKASEVDGFRRNGEVYHKLPIVEDGKVTNQTAFMQALAFRGGYTVYRYTPTGSLNKADNQYFVFMGGEYVLTIDHARSKHLTMYFNYVQ